MPASNIVILHGGLGNQLFQHAALRSLDPAGNAKVRHLFGGDHWPENHPTLRDIPGVEVNFPNYLDMARWRGSRFFGSWKRGLLDRSAALHELVSRTTVIRQQSPFEQRPLLNPHHSFLLDGYFQHPSWFAGTWVSLAQELLGKAPIGFSELVAKEHTVVKVRRTDYLDLGWELPADYFLRAFERAGLHGSKVVVSFEDESEKEWLDEVASRLDIELIDSTRLSDNEVLDDFWNMAAARTLILANSSFCWWAAAVASVRNPDTLILYPDPWVVNLWDSVPPPDLGLPGWIDVESGLNAWRVP